MELLNKLGSGAWGGPRPPSVRARRFGVQHNDSEREQAHILLLWQLTVECHEHIKVRLGTAQECAVLQPLPAAVLDGFDFMAIREITAESKRHVLVQPHPHEALRS